MPKAKTEKLIEELFGPDNEKLGKLRCPKCRNTETFSTFTTALAIAFVDKSKKILEIKDLLVDLEESVWQCEKCDCIFDEYGDRFV